MEYKEGKGSYDTIARKYGISHESLRQLAKRAEAEGIESVRISRKNRKYSAETKIAAVQDYLSGKGSLVEMC